VAGSLGAGGIQRSAGRLEKAIAAKSPGEEMDLARREFGAAMEDFVARLHAGLPPVETVSPSPAQVSAPGAEETKRVVQEMIAHLNNFDPAAGECFESHRHVFSTLLPPERFSSFEQHVEGFAFAEALAELEPAAREKGILSL
jgi:hypothetical protein